MNDFERIEKIATYARIALNHAQHGLPIQEELDRITEAANWQACDKQREFWRIVRSISAHIGCIAAFLMSACCFMLTIIRQSAVAGLVCLVSGICCILLFAYINVYE